ncbi:MAG: DUF1667 domain-containing protein [Chloroflexi bacterium]|nr:DUF1667 domain-containing protein [Chloroflexota bacterium]
MAEQKEFICITCPVGCTIQAIVEGEELRTMQGHACRRGIAFVREELTDPRRMLTTTVQVRGGVLPLVPVRSMEPLPKHALMDAIALLRKVELQAPVKKGQVVLPNVLGTGVDIITSRAIAHAAPNSSE